MNGGFFDHPLAELGLKRNCRLWSPKSWRSVGISLTTVLPGQDTLCGAGDSASSEIRDSGFYELPFPQGSDVYSFAVSTFPFDQPVCRVILSHAWTWPNTYTFSDEVAFTVLWPPSFHATLRKPGFCVFRWEFSLPCRTWQESCWSCKISPHPDTAKPNGFGLASLSVGTSDTTLATRASNLGIGDAGARALFARGNNLPVVPEDFSRGLGDLAGFLLAVAMFLCLCRALKNHIGSSGVVACMQHSVCQSFPDPGSVEWALPWKLAFLRFVRFFTRVRFLKGFRLSDYIAAVPQSASWTSGIFLVLCTHGIATAHFTQVASQLLAQSGFCLGLLTLWALLRLVVRPLGWKRTPLGKAFLLPLEASIALPLAPLACCAQVTSECSSSMPAPARLATARQDVAHDGTLPGTRGNHGTRHSILGRFFKRILLGLGYALPSQLGYGPVWAGHVAFWTFSIECAEASFTSFRFDPDSDLEPEDFPQSPEPYPDEPRAPQADLRLGEGDWVPGLGPPSMTHPSPVPDSWPSVPAYKCINGPVLQHDTIIRLPVVEQDAQKAIQGEWLGIVVYAPYFQPRSWAAQLHPGLEVTDVMDALLGLGPELFDEGIDAIVPVNPPRYKVYAEFLAYPSCLGSVDGCRYVAVIVDATCVGGHYFATVMPHSLQLGAFLAYIQSQTIHETDELLVYSGCNPVPATEREHILLDDGDVITVLTQAGQPPLHFDVRELFRPGAERGQLRHIPKQVYSPGFCLICDKERWFMQARYHSSRTPAQAAAFYLDKEEAEVTLCYAEDFIDLDLLGEACLGIIGAACIPPLSAAGELHQHRLDVFTFLDFRPIGFKPQVHYSHSYQLHIPTLLALYDIRISPDFGLAVSGGVVHRDFVMVPQVVTLRFRAFPLEVRRFPSQSAQSDEPAAPESARRDTQAGTRDSQGARSPSVNTSTSRADAGHCSRSRSPHRDTGTEAISAFPIKPCVYGFHSRIGVALAPPMTACLYEPTTALHEHAATCMHHLVPPSLMWKQTETPDLTVLVGGEVHLTHEEHLRALFFPFGEGNLMHGAPPVLLPQQPLQEADEELVPFQASFLLLTPDFMPEVTTLHLRAPSTVPEVFFELDQARERERKLWFPWLTPAQPQLSDEFGVLVAAPNWTEDLIAVFDLRSISNTIFALCVPNLASREDLLVFSGLGADFAADVFVHISPEALLPGQVAALWTGVTIVVSDPGHAPAIGLALEELLRTPTGWNPDPVIPGQFDPAFLLLSDEGQSRFPIDDARRAQTRQDIADALGYDVKRTTLRGVRPSPRNSCLKGWKCSAFVIATQQLRRPTQRSTDPKAVAFDLRALLRGLTWEFFPAQHITLSFVREKFEHLRPQGYHLVVTGGRCETINGEEAVRLEDAQRLIVAVQADVAMTDSSSAESDESPASDDHTSVSDDMQESVDVDDSVRSRSPRDLRVQASHRAAPDLRNDSDVEVDTLCDSRYSGDSNATGSALCKTRSPLTRDFLIHQRTKTCKLLNEPQPTTAQGSLDLAVLRFFAPRLGPPWRYLPPPTALMLRDSDSSGDEEAEDPVGLRVVTFGIVTPGFITEKVSVSLQFPATVEEALAKVAAARNSDVALHFPRLCPARPQPIAGCGLLVASPPWLCEPARTQAVVCFDTSRIDGRVFAVCVPPYLHANQLLCLAEVENRRHVRIAAGDSDNILGEDAWHHAMSGDTFIFLTPDAHVGPLRQLEMTLSRNIFWTAHPIFPAPDHHSTYMLVLSDTTVRAATDFSQPFDHRRQLAAALGFPSQRLCLHPAAPPVTNAAMDGFPCRAVLAVSELCANAAEPPCSVLLDLRAFLLGWRLYPSQDGWISATRLFSDLASETPCGFVPFLVHHSQMPAHMDNFRTTQGQVLVLGLRTADRDASSGAPSAPPEETMTSHPANETQGTNHITGDIPAGAHPAPSMTGSTGNDIGQYAASAGNDFSERAADERYPAPGALGAVLQSFTGIFVILGQNYQPELVSARFRVGCDVDAALEAIQSRRSSYCATCLPRLVAVHPQPRYDHAIAIAVPAWNCEGAVLAFDCRAVNGRLFALQLGSVVTREGLLTAAGLLDDEALQVYVKDQPWPLPLEAFATMTHGDLVLISPRDAPYHTVTNLHAMLTSVVGWDPHFALPIPHGEAAWVLAPDAYVLVESRPGQQLLIPDLAQQVAIPHRDLVLRMARPAISNYAHLGTCANNVVVASSAADPRPGDSEDTPICFLDLRPTMARVEWYPCPDRQLRTGAILESLRQRCPPGFSVGMLRQGLSPEPVPPSLPVEDRSVIIFIFHRLQEIRAPLGQTVRVPAPSEPRPTSYPNHATSFHSAQVRPALARDAGTGGTSRGLGDGRSRNRLPNRCTLHSGLTFSWPALFGAILCQTLCFLILGLLRTTSHLQSCLLRRRTTLTFCIAMLLLLPCVASVQFDGRFVQDVAKLGDLCVPSPSMHRHLPTPCRAELRLPLRDVPQNLIPDGEPRRRGTDGSPDEGSDDVSQGTFRTLLEDSVADPECEAFFNAATLVDTLIEYFSDCGLPISAISILCLLLVSLSTCPQQIASQSFWTSPSLPTGDREAPQ